jgi:hypothetical protein
MGVLRWRSLLDSEIAASSAQPISKLDLEILTALRLAVYQLRWLSRIPARAAINESVDLVKRARKRSAAPFVNAVLRKLANGTSPSSEVSPPAVSGVSPETLAASSAHPLWLVERWIHAYGLDSALEICRHNQSIPVTAIRLRRSRSRGPAPRRRNRTGSRRFPCYSRGRVRHGDITKNVSFPNRPLCYSGRSLAARRCSRGARRARARLLRGSWRKDRGHRRS